MSLSNIPNYALLTVVFLLMISILVAAHELGHYFFARLFGMGVEEFSIGFGRKPIFTWMRRTYRIRDARADDEFETTNFTVRPWPLGGFVRLKGMMPEEDGSEIKELGGFYSKPIWQRIIVLFAGPAFSLLTGVVMLIPLYATVGVERVVNQPVVFGTAKGSPAEAGGLKPGDRILSVEGRAIPTYFDLVEAIKNRPGDHLGFVVQRGKDQVIHLVITPKMNRVDSIVFDRKLEPTGEFRRQAIIGITLPEQTYFQRLNLWDSIMAALDEPARAIRGVVSLVQRPANFGSSVSGPVSMVEMTQDALQHGISEVVLLAAMLSISLGIFNLLPFSPMDGGQILVAVVELFRGGRRLSISVQSAINAVGLTLTLSLVLCAWFFDFRRAVDPPVQMNLAPTSATHK